MRSISRGSRRISYNDDRKTSDTQRTIPEDIDSMGSGFVSVVVAENPHEFGLMASFLLMSWQTILFQCQQPI